MLHVLSYLLQNLLVAFFKIHEVVLTLLDAVGYILKVLKSLNNWKAGWVTNLIKKWCFWLLPFTILMGVVSSNMTMSSIIGHKGSPNGLTSMEMRCSMLWSSVNGVHWTCLRFWVNMLCSTTIIKNTEWTNILWKKGVNTSCTGQTCVIFGTLKLFWWILVALTSYEK